MGKIMKKNKDFCLVCKEYVISIIQEKFLKFNYEDISINYIGKEAICPICGETLYNDEIVKSNQEEIKKAYKERNEIIKVEEIKEIMLKYNIGKRPLSLLLGFGEITITRYFNGYLPTITNSQLLKKIYNSPEEYFSILQTNKNNISDVAYRKSYLTTSKLLNIQEKDEIIFELAKYIVNKIDVTNMALQKILYYTQMFYMALYDKVAFNSKCNAWDYGPVFDKVYYKYKKYGKNILEDETTVYTFDIELKNTVDKVIRYFGCYTGLILRTFTHHETPWLFTYEKENKVIDNKIIKEYGKKIIKDLKITNIDEIKKYSEYMFNRL